MLDIYIGAVADDLVTNRGDNDFDEGFAMGAASAIIFALKTCGIIEHLNDPHVSNALMKLEQEYEISEAERGDREGSLT